MSRVEIGYLCGRGHFQLIGDPEGDMCGTKSIGTVFFERDGDTDALEAATVVDDALEHYWEQVEAWRESP